MRRGSFCERPQPGAMPTRAWVSANRASVEAIKMSHISATSNPPVMAKPLIAPMIGPSKAPIARDSANTKVTELVLVTERPLIRDGRVQKDPDTGYTKTDAEFHKITVFNGMGLPLRDHKAKGDKLAVTGRLHYSRWQDADGNDRYGCEIIAENVEFI